MDNRILLLDGAMGTMIQTYGLTEIDYRGDLFDDSDIQYKGCHDLLSLTRPDVIAAIHRSYLEAGADIITTNTFNANAISLSDYRLSDFAYRLNLQSAAIARREADKFIAKVTTKPRFVAGTMGPTNKTASMSADIMNPDSRAITFDQLKEAYSQQVEGLLDGGCDIILIETVFDTLNAKAALYAVSESAERRGTRIPIMLSATIADTSGRTLSGQTLEAFYASVSHADLLTVGLNCAFGPQQLLPFVERLAQISEFRMSCHPNAGLPNEMGEYDETPHTFASHIQEILCKTNRINIVGGCCGTTPAHIKAIADVINDFKPGVQPSPKHLLSLSNLEALPVNESNNFINIGERTNVAGSAKFARLIREGNFTEALKVAFQQIEAGAQIIDVCMDDAMIDAPHAMTRFLNLIASEPAIAKVPIMIDSSDWNVIEAGLKVCQGKCIVNSISLKEGEASFIKKASLIHRYGAAAVVMLFDEQGQADTFERKCQVAERSYKLLIAAGFPPHDIIFDPNVLTIATGIPEHDSYALDFIRATKWIKDNLPHCHVSGGISNLSFAFRGNNPVREAMHSVFLYHAIKAGLDMAIVNSQMLKVYTDIEPGLLERTEDVVLMRKKDATERLLDYAAHVDKEKTTTAAIQIVDPNISVEEQLGEMLLKGASDRLVECLEKARAKYSDPLAIIEGVLMPAMDKIGELFGDGKMFLPQVIKSARVLKEAISYLAPYIKTTLSADYRGKVLIATVRGDIHDIGKNIVSLVVGCNGYDVEDLGVMADAKTIADKAEATKPLAVMLSGLITPSLNEMVEVCKELERRRLTVPVIIGGATTSPLHTALKISPVYSGVVLHAPDASYNSRLLATLTSDKREEFIAETKRKQAQMRTDYDNSIHAKDGILSLEEARERASKRTSPTPKPLVTEKIILSNIDISEVEKYINWDSFYAGWGLNKKSDSPQTVLEKKQLYDDARLLLDEIKRADLLRLEAVTQIFPAHSHDENIVLDLATGSVVIPTLRDQSASRKGQCAADFIAAENGFVCLFALTAGVGLKKIIDTFRKRGDDYRATMAKLLTDRLTEAFAEKLHSMVRRHLWGFESGLEPSITALHKGNFRGCRLAFGYPSLPDHTLKREVFALLNVEKHTSMRLTGNAMITPEESICGIITDEGSYMSVNKIDSNQLSAYSQARGTSVSEMKKLLPFHLIQ
ncbi:MAG: methionine synthase [Muribaculaceae bacterium]|nr:methionine synthase [Muribaculaceae bacterium]